MKAEELKFDWRCGCHQAHKCLVIGPEENPDILEIAKAVGEHHAFCHDPR